MSHSQEISLSLDKYDDIFSDFDLRPYENRALSRDFVDEIRRASHDKDEGSIELIMFLPAKERDLSKEPVIVERLLNHFKRHLGLVMKERHSVLKRGIGMVVLGIIFMLIATLAVFEDPSQNHLLYLLVVFLEPAALFLLWEGMDQIIFNSKSVKPDLDFYSKMSKTGGRIRFESRND